jgi:hypothetical protein
MSGYALEPVGLYGLAELGKEERIGATATAKKRIDPSFVKGVIVRVPKAVYPSLVQHIEPILGQLGHAGHWTSGSAGSWHPSHPYAAQGSVKLDAGDIDVHIPSQEIRQALGVHKGGGDPEIRVALRKYLEDKFEFVYATGEQVHVGYPSGQTMMIPALGQEVPTYYQIDFPTTEHASTTVRHHEHEYAQDYQWDGQDQQFAMASLVNSIPGHAERTHLYHGMGGALKHRATGEVQERDIDAVAKKVFGDPQATQDWLATVDRILDHLPHGIKNPRLAQWRGDMLKKYPNRAELLKEGTADWFAAIRQKLAL